jgi:hypothetical protein
MPGNGVPVTVAPPLEGPDADEPIPGMSGIEA